MPQFFDVFISPIRDNPLAQVLVAAVFIGVILDVVLGLVGAALRREIKSSKMREGIQHKIAEFGLLLAADIIDGMLAGGFDLGIAPVLVSTAGFLAIMEVFSICENCIKMNPDFVDVPLIGKVAKLVHEAKGGDQDANQ
jgi:phage-related holin